MLRAGVIEATFRNGRSWRFLPVHGFELTVRNGIRGRFFNRLCSQAETVRRWRSWTWRFSRTDRVRLESDGRRDGSHMFCDKLCGCLQAFKRNVRQRIEGAALVSESLARKPGLVGGFHLAPCIRPRLRLLDPVVGRKPGLDPLVLATMRFAGKVERERLVGLGGRVFGDALP